jgi:hypothetical protein
MKSERDDKRITLLIDAGLAERLSQHVPFGFRRHVLNAILELLADALDEHGKDVLAALVGGKFKLVSRND